MRSAAILLLVLLVGVAGWLGKQAYTVYSGLNKIHQVVLRPTGEPTISIPPFNGGRRVNFLLLGSDNDQKKEESAPLTQSMIVVTLDPANNRVGLLSIPRDFYVHIPGHGQGKIDLAFKYGFQHGGMNGGVALARDTVERLFHIQIDYYGWVGLTGFSRVIDTFGGVTIDVQHPILDDSYPNDIHSPDPYGLRRLFIPAGWQHMSGPSALEYVRSRHGDIHGDFGRSERQQQVLLQIKQKTSAMNVLTRLPDLVSAMQDSIRTDLSVSQLYQLDEASHRINKRAIERVVLQAPTFCKYDFANGESILRPLWKKIDPVIRRLFAPVTTPTPASVSAHPTAGVGRTAETATPQPTRAATPRSTVKLTPTPKPAPMPSLPGSLLFVKDGNILQLSRHFDLTPLTYSGDTAMPQLSPDGRTLAYVRFTNGLHRFDKYASDIWLMDLATRRQHVVSQNESSVPANNVWSAWPSWTSDSNHLLFSTDRTKLSQVPSDTRPIDFSVWSMDRSGATAVPLTSPQQGAGGDTDAAWRPHSTQFVYVRWTYQNDSSKQPSSQLVLEDATTKHTVSLTRLGNQTRVLQPAWDPSGKHLTFLRSVNGHEELVLASLRRGASGPLLAPQRVVSSGPLGQPSFTPDGRWISFLRATGDDFMLYLAPVDGGQAQVVEGMPNNLDARWRPVWTR